MTSITTKTRTLRADRLLGAAGAALVAGITLLAAPTAAAQAFDAQRVVGDLTSGETERVQRARDAAADYLGDPTLSVSDRLATVSAIGDAVTEAAASDDDHLVTNALLIAGRFVTPSGFQVLTESLGDSRPGVRYAACRGLRSSFEILADQASPSLQPQAARRALDSLLETAADEQDLHIVASAYRAIAELLTVTAGPLKPLESYAGERLASIADSRVADLAELDASDYPLALGSALYTSLEYRRLMQQPGRRIEDSTIRAAAALAGEIIGHAYGEYERAGSIEDIDADRRELLRQAIATAESVAYLAAERLGAEPTQTSIAQDFGNADDRAFRAGIFRVIGPAGTIPGEGIQIDLTPTGN